MTISERFWSKVDKTGRCWEWTAAAHLLGYGTFWNGSKLVGAHRWAYEQANGEIGPGLELDHLCRNPRCVRPDHLEPVSHTENVRRGRSGWNTREKTCCPVGHAYTEENTLMLRSGSRVCRICKRERQRARYIPRPRRTPTECPQGHAYTPDNVLLSKKGHRACRECNRIRGNARYAAGKAA